MTENIFNEEHQVELPAIEQLKKQKFDYIHGEELHPEHERKERNSLKDVVLEKSLRSSLMKINPWLSEENLNKVVRDVVVVAKSSLYESNKHIHDMLSNYISVEQDLGKGRKNHTVKIIDFENVDKNEFLVVNQFKVSGPKLPNIIPDIVIFVNGLPLVVIECKSPYITSPLEEAINQLRRYANRRNPEDQEGAEKLFWYNQLMIATSRDKAVMGTISSSFTHYLAWKEEGNDSTSQEVLIRNVFQRETLLDIIQNYILFDKDKKVKIAPRYQQYRAVSKSIDRLKNKTDKKERGGVIWHTQGSGKSFTMVYLAAKIRRDPTLRDYKLVFITDRTDLQGQLKGSFDNTDSAKIVEAENVKHFKELLKADSSDLVIGMLQKFQERELDNFPELNISEKVIVLVDEAHRGHYKTFGANINIALPNAPKIAFTGTPLMKDDMTEREFGPYIDKYTIEEAVMDGATVQIIYEGRESKTKVTGDSLDKLFEEYFADRTPAERNEIVKRYGKEIAVLEAPKRIEEVAKDILKHYREKIEPDGFKAQIVTVSRRAAVLYKQALDKLGAPESAVIISGNHNDEAFYTPYTKKDDHVNAIKRFKKPMKEEKLSFLIVKDMLLTGFDAPIEQVMYLDRKLTDHNLLQAIARVNRTYQGGKKDCGYIVDYFGLSDYLKEALEVFSQKDVKGALTPLKEELPKLEARHQKAIGYFKAVDIKNVDVCIEILRDERVRAEFEIDFKKFLSSMNRIMPDKMAAPFISDMRLLGKINHGARNRYRDEQLSIADAGEKVRKLIDEHIYSEGIDPKIPPTALFDGKFKAKVNELKNPKAQAAEIEYAIRHHIKNNFDENPEYFKELSKKLKEILDAKSEKWEELVQLLMDFREGMEKNLKKEASTLGLSETQYAFFRTLEAEVLEKFPAKDKDIVLKAELLQVTNDLVKMLEEVTQIVDFFKKGNEIKRAEKNIRRRLLETKFCEDDDKKLIKDVTDKFMDLAKVKYRHE